MTRLEDLADLTLIDENTKLILIDDANKEIPSKMTIHVVPPGGQISNKWNIQLMQVAPPVAKFATNV